MQHLSEFIQVYRRAGCSEYCKTLIDLFENNIGSIEHHDEPGYKFEQLNVNLVNVVEAQRFAVMCANHATIYFNELGFAKYIPVYGFEEVRIKKYIPGDSSRFETHVDVRDHATARRFLTFIMYLTDNREGETKFPTLDLSIMCEKGKLIAFPPTWQYPHAGLPPVLEPKYICMTSLHYL